MLNGCKLVFLIARENPQEKEEKKRINLVVWRMCHIMLYLHSSPSSLYINSRYHSAVCLFLLFLLLIMLLRSIACDDGHFHGFNTQLLDISSQFSLHRSHTDRVKVLESRVCTQRCTRIVFVYMPSERHTRSLA